jgi:DNA topoisomerase-2
MEDDFIKSIKDNSTKNTVNFTIETDEQVSLKSLDLIDSISISNMVLFDIKEKINRYNSPVDILKDFCDVRYKLYETRKAGLIKGMESDIKYLKNKIRFIEEIVNNTIELKNRSDDSLEQELIEKKYDRKPNDNEKETYDYLLSIQVRHMTGQKLKELQEKCKDMIQSLEAYRKRTIKEIWIEELDELMAKYKSWCKENDIDKIRKKKF